MLRASKVLKTQFGDEKNQKWGHEACLVQFFQVFVFFSQKVHVMQIEAKLPCKCYPLQLEGLVQQKKHGSSHNYP